ncbi:RagB/SusD family nutrient uptake outer membrane protein [Patiriisocius hiemis]|uniref:RagB/SusD family nutrient uptake outer membrane protein n=1 Tax=Patiriisocius hiemis TaxID=3075604 RepID=A0ABU2YFC4_9FLAO|nr:RagB/SusD family nutrient uptake outer membrane protein [Constantimarinum sp. W242]MDT0556883.1 RagB/SusD family nutrient uptake outer membrane protein [Constantimarinum sp. W242]
MKKIKKLILLVFFTASIVSCNDAIEITQPGILGADQAFSDVEDLRLGLLGAYNNFDVTQEINFNAVFTDEISIGVGNGGQGIADYSYILNPSSSFPTAWWINNLTALNSINRVLEAAEGIEPEAGEQQDYNDIVGQLYALRAFAHFQLASYLSTDYSDDSALSTILLDFVPSVVDDLPRNTNGEIFGLIDSDLTLASNLIADQSNPVFASKDFVTALRARIAAYRGNYAAANNFASQLLNSYPIANRDQYSNMFIDEDNTEIIFKLSRQIGDPYDGQGATGSGFAGGWAGAVFAFVNPTASGGAYFEMSRTVFNNLDPADIRYDVNVHPTSLIDPDYLTNNNDDLDILAISKYPGKDGQPLMNDLKIFRSSEMLLIKAEALADAGSFNGPGNTTAGLLKQLRDARFGSDQPLPNFASEQEAFGAIMDERRIELVYEGHRYKDLKRLGQRAGRGIDRDPNDCDVNNSCTPIPTTSNLFSIPVPLVELNANEVIQQNPGY